MRKSNKLSAAKVAKVNAPGLYGDGDGLWLQVREVESKEGFSLAKSWILRFMLAGQDRYMGLGPLRRVSLSKARERKDEAHDLIYQGIDPIEARRKRRDELRSQTAERITFKDAAKRFLDLHRDTWKNAKHKQQWANTLRDYAYPSLGTRPIAAIDGAVITEALQPIWTKKPETASRVKQRIERVIQWVKDGTPLPIQGPSKRVQHLVALPFAELPAFMAELSNQNSVSARALEFAILTAARTSEVLGAKWSEIDEAVWTIPAERMKAGREHQVPLSKRALEILDELPRERGGYLFPGAGAKSPLSSKAMLDLLRDMRGDGITVHGFRSSFRDWAGDRTHYAREVIEHALAHQIKDKAEAAYRRSDAPEKRRRLMEEWAKYCYSPAHASGEVMALHG